MSKGYESTEVLCPFYHDESHQKIRCEGVENGTAIHLAFDSQSTMKSYKVRFCTSDYDSCRVAQMLNAKYEEGEDQ